MSWTMTVEEREAFLADLHVGVLSVAAGEGQPPVTAPVWYTYEPGGLLSIITARQSVKVRRLRAEGQGREDGDRYIAATRDLDNLTIRIAPQRWRTVDYGRPPIPWPPRCVEGAGVRART